MSQPDKTQTAIEKVLALPKPPVVIEASWDGDSGGWMVIVSAIVEEPSAYHPKYKEYGLSWFRGEGGDMRLFNGQVPPWPEGEQATQLGRTLSEKFGVPFYFLSPEQPNDECARWWEQDKGKPCERCGKSIVQADSVPYHGVCFPCHLQIEREMRKSNE